LRIPLAIKIAGCHGRDTSTRSKDDMNWNGNIITEGVIVEDIDGEEENNVEYPTTDGNLVRCKEEATVLIKLSDESRHSDEEKLNKGQESSFDKKMR
jgi:hypothetical protein